MNCPKCGNEESISLHPKNKNLYCPKCNTSFKKDGSPVTEGSLSFSGIASAKQVFDILTEGREMSPELRTALETQIVGIIFEQWFEGFKAGQIANIVYVKEHYGKDGSKPRSAYGDDERGIKEDSGERCFREDGINENPRSSTNPGPSRIRELLSGVSLSYPKHVRVPENVYAQCAEIVDTLSQRPKEITYDGRFLNVVLPTGIK